MYHIIHVPIHIRLLCRKTFRTVWHRGYIIANLHKNLDTLAVSVNYLSDYNVFEKSCLCHGKCPMQAFNIISRFLMQGIGIFHIIRMKRTKSETQLVKI